MKLYMYSVYDKKVKAFATPVFDMQGPDVTVESLKRAIRAGQFKPNGKLAYYIGIFDDDTGKFEPGLEQLCNCEELVPPAEVAEDGQN